MMSAGILLYTLSEAVVRTGSLDYRSSPPDGNAARSEKNNVITYEKTPTNNIIDVTNSCQRNGTDSLAKLVPYSIQNGFTLS